MPRIRIIDKMLNNPGEQVTYWPPVLDTMGNQVMDDNQKPLFAKPVQVQVFWMDSVQEYLTPRGEQRVSKSVVFTSRDMHFGGLLYRAPLNRLNTKNKTNPRETLPNVEMIQRFDKTPTLKYTQFIRKAYI